MKKQFSIMKTNFGLLFMLLNLVLSIGTTDAQYLDNLSDTWSKAPTAAYSTRKVMSTYTGPAMRLRRSNDNAETDVFFDGNGWVSLASNVGSAGSGTMLVDWVGVNSAYVTKWYDQSGNAKHATPAECTGTITTSTSSDVVTGTGSALNVELAVNTVLYDAADGTAIGSVKTLTSATSVTLNANAAKAISSGKFFTRESQPRFINGGVIDAMPNGRPALYLNEVQNGVSTSGLTTPLVLNGEYNVNLFAVARRTATNSGNKVAIILGNWTAFNTTDAGRFTAGFSSENQLVMRTTLFPTLATTTAGPSNTPSALRYIVNAKRTTASTDNAGVVQLDVNGTTTTSAATSGAMTFNNATKLNLFRPIGYASGAGFSPRALMGYCPEVIYYESTTSDQVYDATDATSLLSVQKTKYMDAVVVTPITIQVGASKSYTTIQAAYNSIPTLITDPYIIELQSDYNPASETFPITMAYVRGVSGVNTITIRPATGQSFTISGSSATQLFKLNGAKYVYIDGRAGGVGSTKALTIENTNTAAGASTIWMANNATSNKVQYCSVKGSSVSTTTNPTSGTIVIGSAAETIAGYGSNTIDNCDIADATGGLPTVGIYLVGTTGFTNEGNIITNNNIYNFFNPGAFRSSGIYVDALAQSSTITGNKLYHTATRSYSGAGFHYPIYIGATTTTVSDNIIGYSNSNGTGTTIIDGLYGHRCAGIYATFAVTTLQGNTVSDIDYTSTLANSSADGVLAGIYYTGGNLTAATVSKPNTIKNLTLRFNATTTFGLLGYSYNYTSGSAFFAYTNVNNLNSIPTGTNANTISGNVIGIYSTGPYGGSNKFNTVYNLSCGVSGSAGAHTVTGISANTGSNQPLTSERNLVYNLNAISTGASIITGINCSAGTGVATYKNNIVALGNDVVNAAEIRGIYKNSIGKDLFYHNSVYIGGTTTGTTANTYAYYRSAATPSASGEEMTNNIFVNKRSGGTTGNHYAFKMQNAADYSGGFISNTYNLYQIGNGANNKMGNIGTDIANFSALQTTYPNFATGSINADPNFIDPTNATTPNMKIIGNTATVNAVGAAIAAVTDDYYGSTRSGLTPNDLGAYAYTPSGVSGPTVSISSTSASTTDLNPIPVTITFSAAVTGFVVGDLTLGNCTASNFTGSGTTYTVDLTPTAQGAITVDIAANVAADVALNGNAVATQFTRTYTAYYRSLTSGNWGTAATWQSSVDNSNWATATAAPTSTATSILIQNPHEVTVAANATASALTVQGGAKLTVNDAYSLNAASLTLQSDPTYGTATLKDLNANGNINVTGTTTTNQYLTTGRNWYISSPSSTTALPTVASGTITLNGYSEAQVTDAAGATGWLPSPATFETGVTGNGYVASVSVNGNITFTGALNTGSKNLAIISRTGTTNKAGFNLVGNPYPSYLDWDAVATANSAKLRSSTMWYRTKMLNELSQLVYSFWTVNGDGVGVPNGASVKIPPMQSFWVRAVEGVSSPIVVTNVMRSHAPASDKLLKAPSNKKSDRTLVRLQVSNGVNSDEAVVYFNANAKDGFDSYDAPKMSNGNAAIPEIYSTLENEKIVINCMNSIPLNQEIKMGFVAGNATSFSLKASEINNLPENVKVILKDNVTHLETNLTENAIGYQFAPEATNTDRFSLIFRTSGSTTGVENVAKLNAQVFVNSNNRIVIVTTEKSNYAIYNAMGQAIENGVITSNSQTVNCKLQTGIYVVKVGNQSTRVIVK